MCKFWKLEKCNHHFPELNQKRNRLGFIAKLFSPAIATVLVVVLTIVVGFAYLIQTNLSATKGYQIKDLDIRLSDLKEQNKKLNLQYIAMQSVANVVDQAANLNLVAGGPVEVITPAGSAVALR